MSFEWTQHALESLRERAILEDWVEQAFYRPQRIKPDRVDADLEHRLARIVTAYFDRGIRNRL